MRHANLTVATGVLVLLFGAQEIVSQTSAWVYFGSDNRLDYATDTSGNRIMDFSYAGYGGGGVRLPKIRARIIVPASGGGDTAAIQSAIDAVSALALNKKGFRGAVQLESGSYSLSKTLNIAASGVVLRGSGSGPDGTIITMTGDPFLFLKISGAGSWQTDSDSASITDAYVPSGATSFHVEMLPISMWAIPFWFAARPQRPGCILWAWIP